jgi:hypothetical protein
MMWAEHIVPMGEKRAAYRLLVRKPEGKRPLGRPSRRWLDNIKMNFVEIREGCVDCIGLDHDRYRWRFLGNAVMNFWIP